MTPIPLVERFWPKVHKRGPDDCWEWRAYRDKDGYGQLGRHLIAHRVSWELHFGAVPEGLCVLHHCDNPPCCNPRHLFLGTLKDNYDDMVAKGRRSNGERHGRSKLTDAKVRKIRRLYATGRFSQRALADMFGVTQYPIGKIVRREYWRHLP